MFIQRHVELDLTHRVIVNYSDIDLGLEDSDLAAQLRGMSPEHAPWAPQNDTQRSQLATILRKRANKSCEVGTCSLFRHSDKSNQ